MHLHLSICDEARWHGDGYCHVVVLIDHFSKWYEPKPIKNKSALTVAQFLYVVICRHGFFELQINCQGRKFVNDVNTELYKLTGVEQRVTAVYHLQSNVNLTSNVKIEQ